MPDARDDFYVGYLPEAPPALAARTRRVVMAVLLLGLATAALLVVSQGEFAPAVYEFGIERTFQGVVRAHPYPVLEVPRPGRGGGERVSRYWVVPPGKVGAGPLVDGLDGHQVELQGTLIYRDGRTMIEIVPGTIRDRGRAAAAGAIEAVDLGVHRFAGEIVDSKCYLGVMRPGEGKPHRACATRCISGGIPPVLAVRDGKTGVAYLMLVSSEGRPVNREVLDLVGEPVEIRGRLERRGDLLFLRADPSSYRRSVEP